MIPDAWTDAIRKWARLQADIEEVWLYGSFARAEATSESDLDLAVVPKGDADAKLATYICEASGWQQELQTKLPVNVHLELGDPELSDKIVGPALDREAFDSTLHEDTS